MARLGGDEFGILAAAATEREVQPLAERIVARFRPPFALTQALVSTHPSIGIALGRSGDDGARLLRHADVAMYDAKRRGGRRWELFGAAHEALVEQYRLVNELEHAIEAGELRVHYQPIVDLDTHDVVAVEALARWQHPERGLLAPGVFIPLAESNGLVREVDRWVLRTALREVRSLLDAGAWPPGCRVHVNFSPGDLDDPAIVDVVSGALRDHAVPASTLSVEVTESALLEADRTRQHLEGIAELGVSLSLDDFGTRYAVLATLADLPFHTLKIDRSFVLSLENPARVRLFEGIIRLAERLGLDTLAEGIETDEQREAVHHLGCRLGQGYLLGRPMPPDELRRRLAATGAARPAGRGRGTRAADWNLVPRVPGALAPAPSQRAS